MVIGQAGMVFDGGRNPGLRTREMPLGNLITDAMLRVGADFAGAVAAVTNGGGIRASLPGTVGMETEQPPYDVTFGDVLSVLPFGNTISLVDVTGLELVTALDATLSWAHFFHLDFVSSGSFPQVAGMQVTCCGDTVAHIQNPELSGEPAACPDALLEDGVVTSLQVDGAPVDLGATYRIATNNYLAGGGDFYTSFGEACEREDGYGLDTGYLMVDALLDEFALNSPISCELEDRLRAQ